MLASATRRFFHPGIALASSSGTAWASARDGRSGAASLCDRLVRPSTLTTLGQQQTLTRTSHLPLPITSARFSPRTQLAGIIAENWLRGRKRSLWVSVSADLMEDAKRDLRDIGFSQIPVWNITKLPYGKLR
jgi:hypothetical protein